MMSWIFCILVGLSFLFGALTGRMPQVSQAAISSCSEAVQLVITLLGTMCLWSGLMKVADQCRITDGLARLFSPINKRIFKGLDQKSKAAKAICMNMAANLLGLGNAATPLGLTAMRELEKISPQPYGDICGPQHSLSPADSHHHCRSAPRDGLSSPLGYSAGRMGYLLVLHCGSPFCKPDLWHTDRRR